MFGARLGVKQTDTLVMSRTGYPDVHLIDAPTQHLRAIIHQAAVDHAIASAGRTRKAFEGIESVNIHLTNALRTNLGATERRIWLGVIAGAVWTPDVLGKFDANNTGACRFCGSDGTAEHFFWQCPETKEARERAGVHQDVLMSIPNLARHHGIVPELQVEGQEGPWATQCTATPKPMRQCAGMALDAVRAQHPGGDASEGPRQQGQGTCP